MSTENDFAAFEAAANAGEPAPVEAAEQEAQPAQEAASEAAEEPLELTEGDEAVEVDEGEEGGEEHQDADGKRRRSKPASQRIAELTARLRETERELEATRSGKAEPAKDEAPARPNPDDYELLESDPAYIEALTDWKIDQRERAKAAAQEQSQSQQAVVDKITNGVVKAEAQAKAKYEDYDAKLAEAVDARGGEPLHPLVSVAVSISPAGGDILYRLATDEKASSRLEKLANGGNANAFALAVGELEAEYLGDHDDSDIDLNDALDMARMMGRMRARLKGVKAPTKVAVTNAPTPPQQRARGGSGQFTVDGATTDFAAFERHVNGRR